MATVILSDFLGERRNNLASLALVGRPATHNNCFKGSKLKGSNNETSNLSKVLCWVILKSFLITNWLSCHVICKQILIPECIWEQGGLPVLLWWTEGGLPVPTAFYSGHHMTGPPANSPLLQYWAPLKKERQIHHKYIFYRWVKQIKRLYLLI